MRRSLLALMPVLAILAACSSPAGGSPSAPATSAGAPSASTAAGGATRIEVSLTDALKIETAAPLTFKAGTPVTFVVTNTGGTEHEFYLGDEAAQAAHAKEMSSMGSMAHDEPNGIGVKPGATKELTFTFPTAGAWLAGCHVNAHYAAGMKAAITVTN